MAIGNDSVKDAGNGKGAELHLYEVDDSSHFSGFRLPGYDDAGARSRGSNKDMAEPSSFKDSPLKLDLPEETRKAAMSVIDRAYGEGGTSGQKGKNPEIDPAKHHAELKKIFPNGDMQANIHSSIKEQKLASLVDIAKQASGNTGIDAVFQQYKYLSNLTAGIPRPEGKEMETGYIYGAQVANAAKISNPDLSDAELKKIWLDSGLDYEAGLYAQGMAKYLGSAEMDGAESVFNQLASSGIEAFGTVEDARIGLLNALGDIPSLDVLDQKLDKMLRGFMRKSVLLPESASSEELGKANARLFGQKEVETAAGPDGKPLSAKEMEDRMIKAQIAEIKKALGPFSADK